MLQFRIERQRFPPPPVRDGKAMTEAKAVGAEGEALRANAYSLLGALLGRPPTEEILGLLKQIEPDSGTDGRDMASVWACLRLAGERAETGPLGDEYHDLFIGIGRGEVVPYGSWYMTGFLMDRPLAVLRGDLAELGFERQDDVKEPEDHIAALCEIMAMLIANEEHDIAVQRRFFKAHIEPWGKHFFQDLQKAKTARFYRAVGQFGEHFIDFEQKYLSLLV
jgi:TorA maturation chaperone TorD